MNHYLYFILIFCFSLNITFALPRFAVKNGASCIACHVNPTGSGMRNSHGNDVVALEELPLKRWLNKGNENWDGYITENMQIGGDLRMQGIQYNNTDGRETAFFPMQADLYTNLKLNKNAVIFTKIGVKGGGTIGMEYWALISNLPREAWLRVGRTLPNYGLRVDDHTSFIRGGNVSKTLVGLEKEGLLFTPYLSPPAILELGVPISPKLEWTASLGTSLINQNNQEMNNISSKLTHRGSLGDNITYRAGSSYMHEDNFNMIGVSGGISYGDFTWTFALDQAENWIDENTSMALYDELAWAIIQGIQLIGKFDFFDPNTNLQDGSIARYTIGAEIYPLNIMEIKLQIRMNDVDMENAANKDPEYLIQTHLYF